jgi:hypothetical protein
MPTREACAPQKLHEVNRSVRHGGPGGLLTGGGLWRSKPEARTAAEAFCDSGKEG